MARQLNKKQKGLLSVWYMDNNRGKFADDIPQQLMNKIISINDHETIYQNIDRYFDDLWANTMTLIDW